MIVQATNAPNRAPRSIAARTGLVEALSMGSASMIGIVAVADVVPYGASFEPPPILHGSRYGRIMKAAWRKV
jgi:hypothetical protein